MRLIREGSEFIDHPATSAVGRRDGRAIAKKGMCKALVTDPFSDLSGRDSTPRPPVQARFTGQTSEEREKGRGGGGDADDVGLAHSCRVENYLELDGRRIVKD